MTSPSDPPPDPAVPDPGLATSMHVHRAVAGNSASTSWLIERLSPLLLAQARWRMGSSLGHACEPADLVHEAWLILLPRMASLPPRDGRLTPVLLSYLSTTIMRKTQNLLRREARRRIQPSGANDNAEELLDFGGPQSEVISAVVRREAVCQVRQALDELSDQDREIILLRGIEQQPSEDVAAMYGLSLDTMYKRYSRALARLRTRLPDSVFAELRDE